MFHSLVIQPVKKLKTLRSSHSRKAPSCHYVTVPVVDEEPGQILGVNLLVGGGEGDVPAVDPLGAVHGHEDHLVPSVSEHVVTVIRIVKNLLMVASLGIIIRLFFSDEEL